MIRNSVASRLIVDHWRHGRHERVWPKAVLGIVRATTSIGSDFEQSRVLPR
jgi:hypothetical protein